MKRVLIKGSSFTAHKFLHSYSKINQTPDHSFTLLTASTRSRLRFYSSRPDSPIKKKPDPVIESTSVAVKDIALPIEDVSNKGKIWDFNLLSYDLDVTLFLGWLLDKKYHDIGIVVSDAISFWMVNVNLHLWLDHRIPKLEAQLVVYNSLTLAIQRREAFTMFDWSFRIKANRKSEFVGWVKSTAGNFTTIVSQQFKLTNVVRFYFNGTYKV
ncbi:hypothetical protein ES332_A01G144300v1 [Gossypium tomentosum]|uniref:Uncharacterized protein n=1 Tax=Gossypium tomentosum TaxID=34277 RepID=A0A5C7J353_GOSTO|nr:hypothetical protein ES332_1Z004900v1 [Gossypium tomentosum]TYI43082.1 hypothetical protein ES332_A01G144300v1 [Gossypium tomentosum]